MEQLNDDLPPISSKKPNVDEEDRASTITIQSNKSNIEEEDISENDSTLDKDISSSYIYYYVLLRQKYGKAGKAKK